MSSAIRKKLREELSTRSMAAGSIVSIVDQLDRLTPIYLYNVYCFILWAQRFGDLVYL